MCFIKKQPIFNKQMIERDESGKLRLKNKNNPIRFSGSDIQNKKGLKKEYDINRYDENFKNPSSVLKIKSERGKIHPTQKPVALFEYLIKTYTNENDLVLDNCAGSGTTAIAALNTNRNYILMEKEEKYFNIINERIKNNPITLFNAQ
jgi:site-specific DNA-methyltransferase (adenine-specific)